MEEYVDRSSLNSGDRILFEHEAFAKSHPGGRSGYVYDYAGKLKVRPDDPSAAYYLDSVNVLQVIYRNIPPKPRLHDPLVRSDGLTMRLEKGADGHRRYLAMNLSRVYNSQDARNAIELLSSVVALFDWEEKYGEIS